MARWFKVPQGFLYRFLKRGSVRRHNRELLWLFRGGRCSAAVHAKVGACARRHPLSQVIGNYIIVVYVIVFYFVLLYIIL